MSRFLTYRDEAERTKKNYVYRAGPVSPPRGALLGSQSWPPGRWPEKLLSVASSCQGRALTHLGPELFVGEPRWGEVQTKTAPVTAGKVASAVVHATALPALLNVDPAADFSGRAPRLTAAVMAARQSAATPVRAGSAAVIAARQSAATPIAGAAAVIAARQSAATPVAGAAAVIAARESTAGAAAVIEARQALPYPRSPNPSRPRMQPYPRPNASAAVDAARKRRRARRRGRPWGV